MSNGSGPTPTPTPTPAPISRKDGQAGPTRTNAIHATVKTATLTVKVITPDGTGVQGAEVEVVGVAKKNTGADGTAKFDAVPAGTALNIKARKLNYGPFPLTGPTFAPGEQVVTQTFAQGSANSITMQLTGGITSQTVATQPANRARPKVGVGEEVTCTFSLGSASWSLSGVGSLSSTGTVTTASGASVSYFAPDTGGTATITATGSGCAPTITFTIVPPSTVHMDRTSAVQHTAGFPDVGMKTSIYVGPDDVSFYNIQYHEVNCMPVSTGVYSCQTNGHDAHPAPLSASTTVVSGKGTQMNATDHVYSGHCGTPPANPTGSELYAIPYEYWVGSGSVHSFASPVNHLCTCQASGALNASKAGASGDTTISAPTVTI